MKVRCSLKSARTRDKNCKLVKRRNSKGKQILRVINKKNPKLKARQG
ncbi:MAG: 50S ribosomal protein L36 [Alphaproteobacteria bacterium]|nr:50S ribosomal protein L36 [Alphaproteobacteria bacterium]